MSNSLENQLKDLFIQQKYSEVSSIVRSSLSQVTETEQKKAMLLLSAQANYYLGKNKQALEDILNCKKLLNESTNKSDEIIKVEIQRAKILRRLGEKTKSLEIYNKILKENSAIITDETKATIYHNLANLYLEKGDFEHSKELFEKALDIDKILKNDTGMAQGFSGLGGLYFYLGEFDQAIDYYNRSLEIRSKSNDFVGQATLLLNLGSTYANMLSEKDALSYLSKAERIFKKLDHKKGEITVLNTKARMFYNLKNYASVTKSLKYLQEKASEKFTSQNLTMMIILINSFLNSNQDKKANKMIDKALEAVKYFDQTKKQLHIADIANLMHLKSQFYYKNKQFDLALEVLEQLHNLATHFNDEKSLVAILFAQSQILYETDNLSDAKKISETGLKLASKLKEPTMIAYLDLLFGIAWKQSDFKECITHVKSLTNHVPRKRLFVLDTIVRTLQLAEKDKITKVNKSNYNLLFGDAQIPIFYQDLFITLISGKLSLTKLEKLFENFKYKRNFEKLNSESYFLLSLNLIDMNEETKMNYVNLFQNVNQPFSLFSRIAIKQVLEEDIRTYLEGKIAQKSLKSEDLMLTLDIAYYSIIFGLISKKYLLENDWYNLAESDSKLLIRLKQMMLTSIITEEKLRDKISEKDTSSLNAIELFDQMSQYIFDYIDVHEVETKSLLSGFITDLIVRTIFLIDSGELSGAKTEKTN